MIPRKAGFSVVTLRLGKFDPLFLKITTIHETRIEKWTFFVHYFSHTYSSDQSIEVQTMLCIGFPEETKTEVVVAVVGVVEVTVGAPTVIGIEAPVTATARLPPLAFVPLSFVF